jgi:autotransporter-associated beta strand protein
MKKHLLLISLCTLILGVGQAVAGVVINDQYKYDFNGVWTSTFPASPVVTAVASTTATESAFGVGAGGIAFNTANTKAQFSCSGGSGNRGGLIKNLNGGVALSTTLKEVVEFDWDAAVSNSDAGHYVSIGLSDASKNLIFALTTETWSATSGLHLLNLNTATLTSNLLTAPAYVTTGAYATDWATAHASTCLGTSFPNGKSYHIKAKLDFATHMVDSITITRNDDNTIFYVGKSLSFISTAATNGDRLSFVATRGKNATNGGNGSTITVTTPVDNLSFYTWEYAVTADVTVNYYDDTDNSFITSLKRNWVVGQKYIASSSDKTSFTNTGFYCVYNGVLLDSSVVTLNGLAHIDLKMKRYPLTAGTYTWTGAKDSIWNELNTNFTTDGTNAMGYQPTNGVAFPETSLKKTLTLNDVFNLGANDFTVNGGGYAFSGIGSLNGTGKVNVNLAGSQALTLNITNNMTGRTQVAGGSIVLAKTGALGGNVDVNGTTSLITNSGVALPAMVFNASSQINTGTNATSIGSMTLANGVKLAISNGYNTTGATTYGFVLNTGGTLGTGTELELNGTGTDNKFGLTAALPAFLANTKVNLKGAASLFVDANQAASTIMNVGSLSGDAAAKLGWGKSSDLTRDITWSVGSLNESTTYAGTITNVGGYQGSGSMYTGNNTHFVKVGTGVLTFSGIATTHNGNFTVEGGELKIAGQAGKATTNFTINNGTLSVSNGGTLTAATVTLAAGTSMVIDSACTVNATNTNMPINGTSVAKLTVPDNFALGALTLTATSAPALGTSYQLIQAKHVSTVTFKTAPVIPGGFTYNAANGVLTYGGTVMTASANITAVTVPFSNGTLVVPAGIELTINRDTTITYAISVAPGGKVTIADGKAFIGNITMQSDATGTASLLNKTGNVSGVTLVDKQTITGLRDWYMSSPVVNATSAAFQASNSANQLVSYDEAANAWSRITNDTIKLVNAKGYVAHQAAATNVTFTGKPIDGNQTIALTKSTSSFGGYNLVGNPYSSYLNWQAAATANPTVSSTIWYRTKNKGNASVFATYNATGDIVSDNGSISPVSKLIPPMQGFWVLATDTTHLNLTNDMRSHGDVAGNLLKSASVDKQVIRLKVSNGLNSDETVLYARSDASDAYDRFDSPKMFADNAGIPEIYTTVADQKLVINGLNSFKPGMEIPVAISTTSAGSFSLQASELTNLDGDLQVILKDKLLNKRLDLTDGSIYTFTSEIASSSDRFTLQLNLANAPTALGKTENEASILVYTNSANHIVVNGGKSFNNALVTVYNIIGKRVAQQIVTNEQSEIHTQLGAGIYVVQVTNAGKTISKKVMVD